MALEHDLPCFGSIRVALMAVERILIVWAWSYSGVICLPCCVFVRVENS